MGNQSLKNKNGRSQKPAVKNLWWRGGDLNSRPRGYESRALNRLSYPAATSNYRFTTKKVKRNLREFPSSFATDFLDISPESDCQLIQLANI